MKETIKIQLDNVKLEVEVKVRKNESVFFFESEKLLFFAIGNTIEEARSNFINGITEKLNSNN